MFPMPTFPTDSLYKFSFIFGLFLIMFSIYFSEGHLNKYDKRQPAYIIDSIKTTAGEQQRAGKRMISNLIALDAKHPTTMTFYHYRAIAMLSRDFKILDLNSNKILDALFRPVQMPHTADTINLHLTMNEIKAKLNLRLYLLYQNHITELDYYNSKINNDKLIFWSVLTVGILMFLVGTYLWYVKIQKPQDQLIMLQLKQIQKQNIKLNTEFMDWEKAQSLKEEESAALSL
jgi:hypothetical protein